MANLSVDTIKSEDGNSQIIFDANLDFSQSEYTVLPKGTTAQRPSGVDAGSLRFNTDTLLVEQYNGVEWVTLNSYGVGRGVWGTGGFPGNAVINTIEYITISTLGNSSYFGDLYFSGTTSGGGGESASCSSSTRGIFGGGNDSSTPTTLSNVIQYITISTTGNSTDFGDLTIRRAQFGACSSSTRGVFGGGGDDSPALEVDTIDYITIATTGNATDFGNLTAVKGDTLNSGCSNGIRGIFGGGGNRNSIDYITIATTGNATDFGDLLYSTYFLASCSSSTRGIFGGGTFNPTDTNVINYITIATTGNSTDFGDLTVARGALGACSSSTRGVFGGGYFYNSPAAATASNIIDYITIASQGTNAQDFGDLIQTRWYSTALSDSHGGLQ